METMLVEQGLTTFTEEIDITPFDQVYITVQAGSEEEGDFSSVTSLVESNEMSSLTNSMQDNIYHILNKGFLEESFIRFLKNENATVTDYMDAIFTYLVSIQERLDTNQNTQTLLSSEIN